jgi:hypothetical protein
MPAVAKHPNLPLPLFPIQGSPPSPAPQAQLRGRERPFVPGASNCLGRRKALRHFS